MKIYNTLLMLALFIFPALADQKTQRQDAELRLSVDGTIEIDPEGRVHDYTIETQLIPSIRDYVDQRVRQWRFEPITVDGRAVIAKTRMRVELVAIPNDDRYQLRVDDVYFGIAKTGENTRKTPRYPEAALRARLGARVILVVRTNADGHVTDVHPYQTSLTLRRSGKNSTKAWRRLFEKAAMDAVAHWMYELDERIDGKSIGGTRFASFEFRITGDRDQKLTPAWQTYIPGPITKAPWQPEDTQRESRLETLKNGEALATSSRFR